MKKKTVSVELEIDDYVYEFYEKLAKKCHIEPCEALNDALFKFAGLLSVQVLKNKNDKKP